MKIFYAALDSPNPAFASTIWRENLRGSLEALGHTILDFDYDLTETFQKLDPVHHHEFIKKNRIRVSEALYSQVYEAHQKEPIQLFFSYFYNACVLPETIRAISALGITTVNWYCNGSYQMDLVADIAPAYDWCLVPEKFRLEDYRRLGARPLYCQEAASEVVYRPYPEESLRYDVSFVGQAYGERPEWIAYLLRQGIDVRVWGQRWERYVEPGWLRFLRRAKRRMWDGDRNASVLKIVLPRSNVGGVLSDDELVRTYSRSKINLGFSSVGNTHLDQQRIVQVRLRDFEIPMAGGFYLVERFDELAEFFEFGKEIETYSCQDELAEKIKFYLSHETLRNQIRIAGRTRCLKDHTWKKRFESAFLQMFDSNGHVVKA